MTITNTDRKITYTGNAATTSWAYGFKIPDMASANVELTEISTGAVTVVDSADYTITGVGSDTGGTVIYPKAGLPLAATFKITVYRKVPVTQGVSVANQTAYNAGVVEGVWDRGIMIAQDGAEEGERAIRMPLTFTGSAPFFPVPGDGKSIIWDGATLRNGPTASEIASAQARAEAAAASAVEAENSAIAAATFNPALYPLKANNLGDLADAPTALTNLGVTAAGAALLDDANAAAQRETLGAAALASPAFTGVPAAPTAAAATNTTQLATTAYTRTAIPNVLNASGSAPIYACRAWVNFNGTGTVAIRASGNVSSVTDNGTGDYTVNFATAMGDVNYGCQVTAGGSSTSSTESCEIGWAAVYAVGSVRIGVSDNNTDANFDSSNVNVAVFR